MSFRRLLTSVAPPLSGLKITIAGGSSVGPAGAAHLLLRYAFQRSAAKLDLRLARETELLGALIATAVSRDAVTVSATFLPEDLPYFVDALAGSVVEGAFRPHYFSETVLPAALADYAAAAADPVFVATEKAHEVVFHTGYGQPLYYDGVGGLTGEAVQEYAASIFTKGAVQVEGVNVVASDLESFVSGSALGALTGAAAAPATPAFYSGSARIRAAGASATVLAVPVKPEEFGAYELLAVSLGSKAVPSPGAPLLDLPVSASALLSKYNGAGLFTVQLTSSDAAALAAATKTAAGLLKGSVEKSGLGELASALAGVKLASALPKVEKVSYVAVGNVDLLPWAEEL